VDFFRYTEKAAAMRNIGLHPLPVTGERVLRLLGITQRPLKSGELANALGLVPSQTRSACESLIEHGYVTHRAMATWALSSKGRIWAKEQGALAS
jgi:predicted transcriptional regulator